MDGLVCFKDGICPHCGGDTHAVNDEPLRCERCGWQDDERPMSPAHRKALDELLNEMEEK